MPEPPPVTRATCPESEDFIPRVWCVSSSCEDTGHHGAVPISAPLAGIRVLDFSRVLSGPHATRMLADLGAEVIKVEPPAGDLTRFSAPRRNGLASYFVQQNVGKSNLSIDLATEAGAEIVRDLVRPRRRGRRELSTRRPRPPRARAGRAPRAQSAADRRLDLRLRPDRSVGEASRLRPGGRGRVGVHRLAGFGPQRTNSPRTRTATPTSTRAWRRVRRSSPRCSSASAPGVGS